MTGRSRVRLGGLAGVAALSLVGVDSSAPDLDRIAPGRAHAATLATIRTSVNWSGFVVTARPGTTMSFTSAAGAWTAPSVTCGRDDVGASAAVWVGLGGYDRGQAEVEQIGTAANCDARGRPTYFAWFEIAPYPAYSIDHKVRPGDVIRATVTIARPLVTLHLANRTRKWAVTKTITWNGDDPASAEWIVEAPTNCVRFKCAQAALANFGSITIAEISATGGSSRGTLVSPVWDLIPVGLVPRRASPHRYDSAEPFGRPVAFVPPTRGEHPSTAGADPGPTSDDGTTFTVSWRQDAQE